jgi:hypothetical protein
VIAVLDQKKDEAILRTFRDVAKHFSEVFSELTGAFGRTDCWVATPHHPLSPFTTLCFNCEGFPRADVARCLWTRVPLAPDGKSTAKLVMRTSSDEVEGGDVEAEGEAAAAKAKKAKKGKGAGAGAGAGAGSSDADVVEHFKGVAIEVRRSLLG